MARQESSVMSSLQQLIGDEDQRRAEQIALAHRRKLEQERELLEQERRRAEQEQRRSKAAKREAERQSDEERAEHERKERERILEFERVRGELELRARVTVMQTEQQHELERLAIARDGRVARLEGQRLMVSALLGTMLAGAVLLYFAVMVPGSRRQEQLVAQLTQGKLTQRDERERERAREDAKVLELESLVARLHSELKAARQKLAEREPKKDPRVVASPTGGGSRPVKVETCTNPNDPLCGNLNAK